MKKLNLLFALIIAGVLIMGCGAATQRSEFLEHDSMYKNWDHLKYSWGGYKHHQDMGSVEKSTEQVWWGLSVEDGMVK